MFQTLRTVLIITIGRYFSRAADLEQATAMMKATLAQFNPWVFFDGTFYTFLHLIILNTDLHEKRGLPNF